MSMYVAQLREDSVMDGEEEEFKNDKQKPAAANLKEKHATISSNVSKNPQGCPYVVSRTYGQRSTTDAAEIEAS